MKLTNTACINAKPKEKPYKLADGGGMYLEITPSGGKLWRLKYRFGGKEKLLSLGKYPQTTLAEARVKREELKKLLANGTDPSDQRKQQKQEQALSSANNFEAVAREWHENQKATWSDSHTKTVLQRLEADIFPALGYRPINSINAPDLLAVVRKIEERGAHDVAKRAVQVCGQIFRYGIVTGRNDRNPAADLRGALKAAPKGHYASIEPDDIPDFLEALNKNEARLYRETTLAIKLLMLTFVRTSELIEAKWSEFDMEKALWSIPAERMKMKRPHIVPLAKQAIKILEELKTLGESSEWILPSQFGSRKHMSNNTILKALERLGYKGRMTGHGFRALAMTTIKERLGYLHEIVDRQLAHAPRTTNDKAYDRAKFIEDRTKMMQEWADYLDALGEK
ncbi:MAG: integrase arm-type DNA-binding domain-containing protein [Micavibrio sp.]|nr:integrase arm-type DNA-binding domain-containing protein [Micavibrio sp.]